MWGGRTMPPVLSQQARAAAGQPKAGAAVTEDGDMLAELSEAESKLITVLLVRPPCQNLACVLRRPLHCSLPPCVLP